MIARNVHETFSYLTVDRDFYVACSIDDVSRVSLSGFFCASFWCDCGVVRYHKSPKNCISDQLSTHKSLLVTPHNQQTFYNPFCSRCLAPSFLTSPSTWNGRSIGRSPPEHPEPHSVASTYSTFAWPRLIEGIPHGLPSFLKY